MSDISITVESIKAVEPHPQADRLEVARILGTQCVVPKGDYQAGDLVVYFPPDMLLPGDVSEKLGVQKYLKSSLLDGLKIPCRVAACRLRTVASYGFVAHIPMDMAHTGCGCDVTGYYRGQKYEPPTWRNGQIKGAAWGGLAPEHPAFHIYTDIQNHYRHPDAIPVGTPVRVTEKIHGTNSRIGVIQVEGEFQFMAGSHKKNRKREWEGQTSVYWRPLENEGVLAMLNTLCGERRNIVVFGELYGPGVQDLDYGVPAGELGYRVFDITDDGDYLDWRIVKTMCSNFGVELVPLLYQGPFSPKMVEALTCGPTTLATEVKSKFKDREGIVITPLVETYSDVLRGRMILKSKSADFIGRNNAEDNGEAA
jgi:RNA ligase (TIGR02306 family)